MISDGIDTLALVVPQPFALRKVEMLPHAAGDTVRLRVRPAPWDVVGETRIFDFGDGLLPVQSTTEGRGMFWHTDAMEYETREGQALLRRLTRESHTDMGSDTGVLTLAYSRVAGFWLPVSVTEEPHGPASVVRLEQYRINAPTDDAVFARER